MDNSEERFRTRSAPKGREEPESTDEREWEFELEIPSQYAAIGTLVAAFLPHLPLLHASIVLMQLGRLPFQRSDEDDDEG